MPKIGSYDYPRTQLGTLLKAVEVLIKKFHGEAKEEKTFAEAIGHKTVKSGGYILKIADLRKYGLMENRGFIATKRAKHIVEPLTPNERAEALSGAVKEISLWRDLYAKIGKSTHSIEDFKIQLVQATGDRDRAVKEGDIIRNLYIDAIQYLSDSEVKQESNNSGFSENNPSNSQGNFQKPPKVDGITMIEAKAGNVYVTMPKDVKSIEIAKKLIDILFMQIEETKIEQ